MTKNTNRPTLHARHISDSNHSAAPMSPAVGDFDPDHPISAIYKEDRLGFRPLARKLAASLLMRATSQGLVISIEGRWGSGKSSLVNLLADELVSGKKLPPEIIRFEPWLVGDRDGMLGELMSDLASAVESIPAAERGPGEILKSDAKKLAQQLRQYGSKLSRQAAPIARIAGALGLPGGEVAGKVLRALSEATNSAIDARSLPQVKAELTAGLHKLNRSIVVIVDDLDRLEPVEAVEIMRLIKAVAGFPNVIYILCYDPIILAGSIKGIISVNNGTAFLEKIVQVRFKVPKPEGFDLQRWLLEECRILYSLTNEEQLPPDQDERLANVCEERGQFLSTPRDVVRVMNAIKLYWPPISDKVDYSDLVWLQLVRMDNESLYSWIEDYLDTYAAKSEGRPIHEEERVEFAKKLSTCLKETKIESDRSMWRISNTIPGLALEEKVADKDRLFHVPDDNEIAMFENSRRLGSAQHSRYYFAFSRPTAALEDSELYSFIASAEAGEDLLSRCTSLIRKKRPQGGTKFDIMMDRLIRLDERDMPSSAITAILMGLANCMDSAGHEAGRSLGRVQPWRPASQLFGRLIKRLSRGDRITIIRHVFGRGEAIGWLAELLRIFVFFDDRYSSTKRVLSDEETIEARDLLLGRFKSADRGRIIDTPDVLNLMYAWNWAGDEDGLGEWVQEQLSTDAGFLKFLQVCRGWMCSDKVYFPLNRRDMQHFTNFDEVLTRLMSIASNNNTAKKERALAEELLEAAKIGEDK